MFLQRSAATFARRVATRAPIRRTFATSLVRRESTESRTAANLNKGMKKLDEIKAEEDLLTPGAEPGTVPTDLEQATGLERLEILGKMAGIDIFDMKPLDASRKGTLDNPIKVKSFGDEQHAGCTGYPADSHEVIWLTMTRDVPIERCPECGNVYEMEYVGPQEDPHAHGHGHGHDSHAAPERPKNMADFIKPEYTWN